MFYGSTGVVYPVTGYPVTGVVVYFDIFDDKKLPVILLSSAFSLRLNDNQFMNSYG